MDPREEAPYSQQYYDRDDLRHQLGSRNRGRPPPYFRNSVRGYGPPPRDEHDGYRVSPVVVRRDRSPPGRREVQISVRPVSNSSSSRRSFSPDMEKVYGQIQQIHKPKVLVNHTPSSSVDGSPHSSASLKEKTPASVAETEEAAAASMEPKPTPDQDLKARRSEAIKAKALEIEKHYRQDCETFRTVVKMLVTKEPSLDPLLQASVDKNMLEMKQRCLDGLRHFVKELDEAITQERDQPDHGSPCASSANLSQMKVDFLQLCSTAHSDTDREQGREEQPDNTMDSAPVPTGSQGRGGEQTGITMGLTPVPELYRPGLATPGAEDCSELSEMSNLSEKQFDPAQQRNPQRMQLYNEHCEKFKDDSLSDPNVWQKITYIRPGRVPNHLPYLELGDRYWELKANSTIISTATPTQGGDPSKVACGVTCYDHEEGPWCEVQSQKGIRICVLAAPPQPTRRLVTRVRQGPLKQTATEGVGRRQKPTSRTVKKRGNSY